MYKQLEGTAMGSTFASFYACLTIGYLEEVILFDKIKAAYPETQAKHIKETIRDIWTMGLFSYQSKLKQSLS